jgi:prepilin peptidase CpaA
MTVTLAPLWTALWFLPPVVAIGIWVAWSDMKFMKIPNKAVLAMFAAYLVIGPVALPLDQWLWGWALGAVVLLVGFLATAAGLIGAGDAKYAAGMAPFLIGADWRAIIALYAACLLGAFAAHRLLGVIPAFRRAAADWESWAHKDFPMGLALAGTIIFYFSLSFLLSA